MRQLEICLSRRWHDIRGYELQGQIRAIAEYKGTLQLVMADNIVEASIKLIGFKIVSLLRIEIELFIATTRIVRSGYSLCP